MQQLFQDGAVVLFLDAFLKKGISWRCQYGYSLPGISAPVSCEVGFFEYYSAVCGIRDMIYLFAFAVLYFIKNNEVISPPVQNCRRGNLTELSGSCLHDNSL